MKISAVIITLNEEKNIRACIESLIGIADEILIIDSLSVDKTESIAKEYDMVRFHKQEWLGYSEQKNLGNRIAKHSTILSIDADEVVSKELRESIANLKAESKEDINPNQAYSFNRLTNYCGSWIRHSGWYPDRKIRVFHRSILWEGDIHEELKFGEETKIENLEGDLHHYSFRHISEHIMQVDKFTNLTSEQAYNRGKKTNWLGVWFRPKWKFFRDFIIKRGFLDGYPGYIICRISAFATYLKYIKLRELNKNEKE